MVQDALSQRVSLPGHLYGTELCIHGRRVVLCPGCGAGGVACGAQSPSETSNTAQAVAKTYSKLRFHVRWEVLLTQAECCSGSPV
jgi:hypothetical protein